MTGFFRRSNFAFIGFSLPTFFGGLVLILIFSVYLGWLPFIYDSTLKVNHWAAFVKQVKQMVMPITVLTPFQTGTLTRFVRAAMLDNLPSDYVRTARAKGLSEQLVILRHVLRNSLIPVVALIALGVPTIFTGAIVTEQIFRINGIGELLIKSIQNPDTPVVISCFYHRLRSSSPTFGIWSLIGMTEATSTAQSIAVDPPARQMRASTSTIRPARTLWGDTWRRFRRHRVAMFGDGTQYQLHGRRSARCFRPSAAGLDADAAA